MPPQRSAVLAVDDGAAAGAGVALVGSDKLQRSAEQFDMLVIDRGHAGLKRADQADRIVAAANTGLEHHEFAIRLLEMQTGQREPRLERAEPLIARCQSCGNACLNPLPEAREGLVADLGAVDPDPLVESQQMR